jgi:Tfp pilus assembly protein FimT
VAAACRGHQPIRYYSGNIALSRHSAGFSLLELLVVCAIMMIVGAIAIPTMIHVVDMSRMRGSLSDISNLAQACRTAAVKSNQSQWLHFTGTTGNVVLFVTDKNSTATSPILGDPKQLSLSNHFSLYATTPGNVPPAMDGKTMWGSSTNPATGVDTYFNSRGLPCSPDPTTKVCDMTLAPGGFAYYFAYQGSSGLLWSAVGVSPAGRIKTWIWDGKAWSN